MQRCKSESQVVNIYYAFVKRCAGYGKYVALKTVHFHDDLVDKNSVCLYEPSSFFKFFYKVDTFKNHVFGVITLFFNFMRVLVLL
jgi:hypothetical protein